MLIKRMRVWMCAGFILVLAAGWFLTAGMYPPLPVEGTTPREALQALRRSPDGIVRIAADERYAWYISRADQASAAERLKSIMQDRGWTFATQEGAGYFFTKQGIKTVVTSRMWTGKYVLFKMDREVDAEGREEK